MVLGRVLHTQRGSPPQIFVIKNVLSTLEHVRGGPEVLYGTHATFDNE